jgi:hypothetical protein
VWFGHIKHKEQQHYCKSYTQRRNNNTTATQDALISNFFFKKIYLPVRAFQRQGLEDNAGVRALRGGGALLYGGTDCGVRLILSYYLQLN